MAWRFTISYVPGCKIPAPDATSRHPDRIADTEDSEISMIQLSQSLALDAIRSIDDSDEAEESVIAATRACFADVQAVTFQAVTWERVRDETATDIHMLQLSDMAEHGFPDKPEMMSPQTLPFWRYRADLSVIDGVLMYGQRIVIPPSLLFKRKSVTTSTVPTKEPAR